MRWMAGCLLMSAMCFGQGASSTQDNASGMPARDVRAAGPVIPAGTKVALSLKQAISTKTAKEGDAVYAVTNFPVALDNRILIPSGTYVQGKISHVQRGGHVKGRAELLIHFTSLIYPSGYTVMLPGALENVPGAEHATTQEEGKIRQDSDTGKKVETAAKTAGAGATIGGLTGGWKGAGIGGGIGAGVGAAIGMLSRGADVRLEPGTSVEMVIQREVPLDGSRLPRSGE
jgi:hypothetical protein